MDKNKSTDPLILPFCSGFSQKPMEIIPDKKELEEEIKFQAEEISPQTIKKDADENVLHVVSICYNRILLEQGCVYLRFST